MIARALLPLALLAITTPALAAPDDDPTDRALQRCLDAPNHFSTAAQVDCEAAAAKSYDRRMNVAYAALLKTLPPRSAQALREAQRQWLRFRDADAAARSALYATREGTMYVPMAAASHTRAVRCNWRPIAG